VSPEAGQASFLVLTILVCVWTVWQARRHARGAGETFRQAATALREASEMHRQASLAWREIQVLVVKRHELLARAEKFIAGFEDDREQEGVPELLADLREALDELHGSVAS
jgi:hypothetical protein